MSRVRGAGVTDKTKAAAGLTSLASVPRVYFPVHGAVCAAHFLPLSLSIHWLLLSFCFSGQTGNDCYYKN